MHLIFRVSVHSFRDTYSCKNRYIKWCKLLCWNALRKQYYSVLVSPSSINPKHLWQTVTSPFSLADRFGSFFTDEIFKLRTSLTSCQQLHILSTPSDTLPHFFSLNAASEPEIHKILSDCLNNQCDSDHSPTWLGEECTSEPRFALFATSCWLWLT